jgi:hypothetical protein
VTVNTTISFACSLVAARTAAVASASVCKRESRKEGGMSALIDASVSGCAALTSVAVHDLLVHN